MEWASPVTYSYCKSIQNALGNALRIQLNGSKCHHRLTISLRETVKPMPYLSEIERFRAVDDLVLPRDISWENTILKGGDKGETSGNVCPVLQRRTRCETYASRFQDADSSIGSPEKIPQRGAASLSNKIYALLEPESTR